MSAFFLQTAIRVRAPLKPDRYNGGLTQDRDWESADETPLPGVNVQPEPGGIEVGETQGDRALVIFRWRLITPRGMDIDLVATDRIRYGDLLLEVDGDVGRYELAGRVHHVEARLRRATG